MNILTTMKNCLIGNTIINGKPKEPLKRDRNFEDVIKKYINKELEYVRRDRNFPIHQIHGSYGSKTFYTSEEYIEVTEQRVRETLKPYTDAYYDGDTNPKGHLVFHGGCLTCKTPNIDGLGTCLECQYFNLWDGDDLSTKYK